MSHWGDSSFFIYLLCVVVFCYCGDIASAVECDKRGVCVRKHQSTATRPRAIAARERKRKLDWNCVYVFVRMVQGYAIALLGTNVTHPVFMKYHPTGTHTQPHTHPDLQSIHAAAAGHLPQGVVHCMGTCLCLSCCESWRCCCLPSPPLSTSPARFKTRARKKDIYSCVQWQNKHIFLQL